MNTIEQLKKQLISLGMAYRNKYAEWPEHAIFGLKERNLIEQYSLANMKPSEIASGKSAQPKEFLGFKVLASVEPEYFAVANQLIDHYQYLEVTKLEVGESDLFNGQNRNSFLGIPLQKVVTSKGDLYGIVLHNTERNPTTDTYGELNQAFDFFNKKLFGGELPKCLITIQRKNNAFGFFSSKKFVNSSGEKIDEIAMNPSYFGVRPIAETLSTLVHEQCHQWQYCFGQPTRGRYHNKEWADKMEEIGLVPSSTGLKGGKRVGQQVSHYIKEGGAFEQACAELLSTEFTLSWYDRFPPMTEIQMNQRNEPKAALLPTSLKSRVADVNPSVLSFQEPPKRSLIEGNEDEEGGEGAEGQIEVKPVNKSNRIKYSCPTCKTNIWGKPMISVLCGAEGCKSAKFEPVE